MRDRDFLLDDDLDLYFPLTLIEGVDLVVQRIRVRLLTQLGTWPLDLAQGLPYLQWMELAAPPIQEIKDYFRRELETTPGVVSVRNLAVIQEGTKLRVFAEIDIVEDLDLYQQRGFVPTAGDVTLTLNAGLNRSGLQAVAILPLGATP